MRYLLSTVLLVILAPFSTGCGDSCGDIACLPAPPPLQVVVYDTLSVDTTIRRLEGTDSIDVDTVIEKKAPTTDAVVTLATGLDSVLTTVDTLSRSDTLYSENDLSKIPGGLFRIVAVRGSRQFISTLRKLEQVEGCCPYAIVGQFTFTLPR
jgi:hypothetical protein